MGSLDGPRSRRRIARTGPSLRDIGARYDERTGRLQEKALDRWISAKEAMKKSYCKNCGAKVIWIRDPTGHNVMRPYSFDGPTPHRCFRRGDGRNAGHSHILASPVTR